jgi:hypothetical protein
VKYVLVEKSVPLCPLLDYHGQYILKKVAMVVQKWAKWDTGSKNDKFKKDFPSFETIKTSLCTTTTTTTEHYK